MSHCPPRLLALLAKLAAKAASRPTLTKSQDRACKVPRRAVR